MVWCGPMEKTEDHTLFSCIKFIEDRELLRDYCYGVRAYLQLDYRRFPAGHIGIKGYLYFRTKFDSEMISNYGSCVALEPNMSQRKQNYIMYKVIQ